jgi:hypothetical protein
MTLLKILFTVNEVSHDGQPAVLPACLGLRERPYQV